MPYPAVHIVRVQTRLAIKLILIIVPSEATARARVDGRCVRPTHIKERCVVNAALVTRLLHATGDKSDCACKAALYPCEHFLVMLEPAAKLS